MALKTSARGLNTLRVITAGGELHPALRTFATTHCMISNGQLHPEFIINLFLRQHLRRQVDRVLGLCLFHALFFQLACQRAPVHAEAARCFGYVETRLHQHGVNPFPFQGFDRG